MSADTWARFPIRARANVDKMLAWVRREHSSNPRPLAELLDDLESLRVNKSEAEAPPPEASDAVRVLTIHKAKGLEFPVVFVSAMQRGRTTRSPAINFSPVLGLGWKWRNPVTGQGVPSRVHTLIQDQQKDGGQSRREPAALRGDDARGGSAGPFLCGPKTTHIIVAEDCRIGGGGVHFIGPDSGGSATRRRAGRMLPANDVMLPVIDACGPV